MKNISIGVILDDFIRMNNVDELLKRINNCPLVGNNYFRLIFYNIDVDGKKVQEFVKAHENLLFKVNAKFTKVLKEYVFFLIDNSLEEKKINFRYRYLGSVEKGLDEFTKMLTHIKNRDNIR
jgi:hypothetical protein